jgi:NADH dehydrogenase [ubiquinone] 1 alpha subcomplex assembly factor 1
MKIEIDAGRWQVINDTVMGGVSRSEILPAGQGLLFRGQLSTENNGGFASIRCHFKQDFDGVEVFRLKVCGDGRRYQFRLRAGDSPDGIAWRALFSTDGTVQAIDVPEAGS